MQNHIHGNTKHGYARRGKKTKTYKTWESMHRRCYMPSQDSYQLYGGRGIKVCDEWGKFERFLNDMGEQPKDTTLDRIDCNKDYSKENCRWASRLQQARNKRSTIWLTFNGETLCLAEWAARLNIKPKTLRARIYDHGWTIERALSSAILTPQESLALGRESIQKRIKSGIKCSRYKIKSE